jgi:redox-sensitive bicupin YhaK (pirin superfamily)
MISLRRSDDRGRTEADWLKSWHSFSFGEYHDPKHVGFGPLRAINEDQIEPAAGFPTHRHRDMEIITYVIDGALRHEDNLGTQSLINAGDVQRMTAGSGIQHSEFNASEQDVVRLVQIWIKPNIDGLQPAYEQKAFSDDEKRDRLCLITSQDGHDGSVVIHQDADVYASIISNGRSVRHQLVGPRHIWIQTLRGDVTVNGRPLNEGDGAAVEGELEIVVTASTESEVLLFDTA